MSNGKQARQPLVSVGNHTQVTLLQNLSIGTHSTVPSLRERYVRSHFQLYIVWFHTPMSCTQEVLIVLFDLFPGSKLTSSNTWKGTKVPGST